MRFLKKRKILSLVRENPSLEILDLAAKTKTSVQDVEEILKTSELLDQETLKQKHIKCRRELRKKIRVYQELEEYVIKELPQEYLVKTKFIPLPPVVPTNTPTLADLSEEAKKLIYNFHFFLNKLKPLVGPEDDRLRSKLRPYTQLYTPYVKRWKKLHTFEPASPGSLARMKQVIHTYVAVCRLLEEYKKKVTEIS